MADTALSTRRAVLRGLSLTPAAAVLSAVPMATAAGQPAVPAELLALIADYECRLIENVAAETARKEADERFRISLRDADLLVVIRPYGSEVRRMSLNNTPHDLTLQINEFYDWRAENIEESARSAKARRLAENEVLRRKALAAAQVQFDRYEAIRLASGKDAALDAECDAYDALRHAKKVLMDYRPATLAEVRAIVGGLYRAAKATGRWWEIPTLELFQAIAPELAVP